MAIFCILNVFLTTFIHLKFHGNVQWWSPKHVEKGSGPGHLTALGIDFPPAPPHTQLHTCSFLPVYLFPLIPESFLDSAVQICFLISSPSYRHISLSCHRVAYSINTPPSFYLPKFCEHFLYTVSLVSFVLNGTQKNIFFLTAILEEF